jgi:BirA family transcriptional regulator, biotin operon repressor / biotin---[acetyl-CoA-carboxylase] ligase
VILDERVRAELAAATRFTDVRLLEVTDSTNRVVAEQAASGSPEGLVVAADRQTAGRGRLDRTWVTRQGDALLVSVLLRPVDLDPPRWHLLTAATGLAALDACAGAAGVTADLKWPNDLLLGGRKLAGILAEATAGETDPTGRPGPAVVVGMGLNVHGAPPDAAFLDEATPARVDRAALLVAWLRALDGLLGRWDAVAADYRRRCSTVGRRVRIEQGPTTTPGVAEGIDDGGRLLLRLDDGRLEAVAVGDVTHLRPEHGEW